MRALPIRLGLAMVLASVFQVGAARAANPDNDEFCGTPDNSNNAEVCFFEHDKSQGCFTDTPYTGGPTAFTDLKQRLYDYCPDKNKNMGDSISSVMNASNGYLLLFEHDNFRGRMFCLKPNRLFDDLKKASFGDLASSLKIEPRVDDVTYQNCH